MSELLQRATDSSDNSGETSKGRFSVGLVAVAVTSSIIASTCCVVPLVLVLLGITGAWMVNLTAMRPLTPVFFGIALGALAWAGYLLFRPVAACSTTDGLACEDTRRTTRRIYMAGALFVGLLLLFPLIAPMFY
ncbi:mercuric transport protein [Oxalobacteraceae bacterium OM1]|nr:mercuric transport protein [Oxalobacteraceae bacterium OM1]